jgi:hypothetical protein
MRNLSPSNADASAPRLGALPRTIAAIALAAMTAATAPSALAMGGRETRTGVPMFAVVALAEQRVTIYDTEGTQMLQAPVSTGAKGLETPAGIYSVVQKKQEHHSNIYEDGAMPFMQRITWTGIALHGGVLPGYPASHGCVRMPMAFAQQLYSLTEIGLRVIIVREDILPVAVDHALLVVRHAPPGEAAKLQPVAGTRGREALIAADTAPGERQLQALEALAAARSQEAAAASRRAIEAKAQAARRAAEAAPAAKALHAAEANVAKAEEALHRAEKAHETAPAPAGASLQASQGREKALASLAQAQRALEAAKQQSQAKGEAAAQASQDAAAAEAARDAARDAADEALRNTLPLSVFISRKTQRLYVRQGNQPVFEGPVAIREPDSPIGTYVFTALADRGSGVGWRVVSMYRNRERAATAPEGGGADPRSAEAAPADVDGARAALDRIDIPEDMRERIWQVVLPGSSLIVSDEGTHLETGKDTDFVVLMSGEPQGGIKSRRREFMARPRGDGFFGLPFGFGLF